MHTPILAASSVYSLLSFVALEAALPAIASAQTSGPPPQWQITLPTWGITMDVHDAGYSARSEETGVDEITGQVAGVPFEVMVVTGEGSCAESMERLFAGLEPVGSPGAPFAPVGLDYPPVTYEGVGFFCMMLLGQPTLFYVDQFQQAGIEVQQAVRVLAEMIDRAINGARAVSQEPTPLRRLCTAGGGAPAFSPDGRFIAVSGSGSACADANGVTVWDVAQGIPRLTLRGHTGSIGALAYSPDGRLIATGGRDQMVRLWDADSGESLAVLREHDEPVSALAFSLDGARLASGGADGTLVYWEVASRRRLWDEREHSAQIRSIVPLADESLTTLSSDGDLLTWSARGSVTHEARISQSAGAVAGMADGRSVALANREDFLVWVQDASFAETYLFEHTMNPEGMAISRDGRRLALTQVVGGVAVFDLPSGRPVSGWQANAGSGNPAFSPDGSVLATRSNREVMLWPAEPASLTAAARATGAVLDSLDLRSIDLQVAAPGWVSSPVADSTGTLGEQVLRSTQRSGSAIVVTFGRSVEPGQSCSTLVPPATSQSDVPWMPAGWIGERRMGALMCLSLAEGVLTARFDGYLSAGADISRVYYLLEAVRQAAIAKWGAV